ncbi:hypothetical protein [Streptomyces jumonjinensis]|uniref:hypothetical protein n=1 Tax=Streptomyces jumonjinensis TaxID=1945 RepID=UPI0037A48070
MCKRPLPSLRRTADLVFTRVKVAVFLDGCFWHGCPKRHSAPLPILHTGLARFAGTKIAAATRTHGLLLPAGSLYVCGNARTTTRRPS